MIKVILASTFCLFLTGCNALQFIDSPGNDPQYLAAARACLDAGDYDCATRYYLKLSNSASDTKISEQAMATLSLSGISVGTFASGIAESGADIGRLVTLFAGNLSYNASSTLRLTLFHNYQTTLQIQNSETQGVLRLITALAFISELFAEDASTAGTYRASDLVSNVSSCLAASAPYAGTECSGKTNKKLISGNSIPALNLATDADIQNATYSNAPTLYMIQAGINELQTASNMIGARGKVISSALAFFNKFSSSTISAGNNKTSKAFLRLLLDVGIGS